MYIGVIYDKQTKQVADYSPEASLMKYTISEDGYLADGTKWLPEAQSNLRIEKENEYTKLMAVLICGKIGDGA